MSESNEELDSVIDEKIAEDFKVNNVLEDIDNNDLDVSSCPFCGKEVDLEDGDTLYPTGSGWRDNEVEGFRTYHRRMEVPRAQWCWSMHCPVASGGCGAEMHGDSRDEAIAKWNRRV